MPFQIVHNDITNMQTDAIVNAANSQLSAGGGVCGAIFKAAGEAWLEEACEKLAPCPVGQAVITAGGRLEARYVIHAVGPVWEGGGHGERELLARTYGCALKLAKEHGCRSVAFPLISSGVYGYPRREALAVAEEAIRDFLDHEDMDVYLVVFDRESVSLSESLYADIRHFVDVYFDNSEEPARALQENVWSERPPCPSRMDVHEIRVPEFLHRQAEKAEKAVEPGLVELLKRPAETFSQMLLRLIDEKGYTDVEVYKRANMDRKLFSKIRGNPAYSPKKQTVLALAVALRLSAEEAQQLLEKAGYTFSNARKQDIIIRYFLERGQYDIYAINDALFCFDQPLLGV